ncbi:MAG: hypothetical protein IPG32_01015 [Saprospirales bacterium]|nr:hypothetical protein [Saprospirales bacterium]
MNLRLLQDHIAAFRRHLDTATEFPLLFAWESQRIFQETWDPNAVDFAAMYEASLENSHSRALWKGERYSPKEMMQLFIQTYPDFVKDMFKDLFDETREADGRVDRFVYHCDELLRDYRDTHPDFIETRHYHEDYRMPALYLAFRYPDLYALFEDDAFRRFLRMVQAKDLPLVADPGRYFKVVRTVYNLMAKDESLLELHYRRLEPGLHFMGKSMLLGAEAIVFPG